MSEQGLDIDESQFKRMKMNDKMVVLFQNIRDVKATSERNQSNYAFLKKMTYALWTAIIAISGFMFGGGK